MRRWLAAVLMSVSLAGCGMEGPPPSKQEDAADNAAAKPTSPEHQAAHTPEKSPRAPKLADWTPDTTVVAQLGTPIANNVTGTYQIQPPARWLYRTSAPIVGDNITIARGQWCESDVDSDMGCTLTVVQKSFKDKVAEEKPSFENTFGATMHGLNVNANREPGEQGRINGIEVTRYRWTGTRESKPFRGVCYFGKGDKSYLIISVAGPSEGHDAAMRLAENSALTFATAPAGGSENSAAPIANAEEAASRHPAAHPKHNPVPFLGWTVEPSLPGRLGGAGLVQGTTYRMRPPAGWGFQQIGGENTAGGRWDEPDPNFSPGPDYKAPPLCRLSIKITSLDGEPTEKDLDAGDYVDRLMTAAHFTGTKESPEKGKIGGMEFSRCRWSGETAGASYQCVTYLGKDGKHLIAVSVVCPAEGQDAAFRLAENAVLTLQK